MIWKTIFFLSLAKNVWIRIRSQIRIRISLKSGIRIRIKTFWIRHTALNG